jgi:hypothetical protein
LWLKPLRAMRDQIKKGTKTEVFIPFFFCKKF